LESLIATPLPRVSIRNGVDQACLWSLSTGLIRSKNRAAFATIPDQITLFNQPRQLTAPRITEHVQ